MKKYLVTFMYGADPFAMIEIYANDADDLKFFIDRFYPDTNFDWQEIETKDMQSL